MVAAVPLAITFPTLLLGAVVVIPAAAVTLGGARPGTRRDLANSLAQAIQALVLVPAAALVAGDFEVVRVALGTGVAAGYLFGTVLVVRSVLRERGQAGAARLSVGWHLAVVAAAVWAAVAGRLGPAYMVVAVLLAGCAWALPVVERRRAGTGQPRRPVHVGIVEIVASLVVAATALAWPP